MFVEQGRTYVRRGINLNQGRAFDLWCILIIVVCFLYSSMARADIYVNIDVCQQDRLIGKIPSFMCFSSDADKKSGALVIR